MQKKSLPVTVEAGEATPTSEGEEEPGERGGLCLPPLHRADLRYRWTQQTPGRRTRSPANRKRRRESSQRPSR